MNKRIKIIFTTLSSAIICIFMMFGLTSNASTSNYKPDWDTSIYNTSWNQADVKYWLYKHNAKWYNPLSWGYIWDDTSVSYIRITDKSGNLINDITRLECSYIIDGKEMHVNEKIDKDKLYKSGIVEFDDCGIFTSYNLYWEKHSTSTIVFKHDKLSKIFDGSKKGETKYQECNYIWEWKGDVSEIQYLYVWYIDETTGKEVASSFYENGAHPKYDENGNFLGVYNSNDELLEGYSISNNGLLTYNSEEINLKDEQKGGSSGKGEDGKDDDNNLFTSLEYILKLMLGISGCIGLVFVIVLILRFFDLLPNKKVSRRRK